MEMQNKTICKIDQLPHVACTIIEQAKKIKQEGYGLLVSLSGDLGAGKTTLTQEIAKLLGVTDKLTSPTFVIMKKYASSDSVFEMLVHIDAYRLVNDAELLHLGFKDFVHNEKCVVLLEWPERVPECVRLYGKSVVHVHLDHIDEQTRTIKIC